jgi:hypothetical protein
MKMKRRRKETHEENLCRREEKNSKVKKKHKRENKEIMNKAKFGLKAILNLVIHNSATRVSGDLALFRQRS